MLKHFHPQPLPHFLPPPPSFDPVSDLTHQRWVSEPLPWNVSGSGLGVHHLPPLPPPPHRLPPLPPPLRLSKQEAARQNLGFLGRPEIVEAKEPSSTNERVASGHVGYPNQTLPGRGGRTSGPDIIEDVLRLRIHDRKIHSTSGSSGYGSDVNTTRHRYLKKATGNGVSGRRVASEMLPEISSSHATTGSRYSVETGSRDEIHFRNAAPLGGAKHVLEKRKPSDNKENRMNKSLSLKPEMTHYHDSSETGTGSSYPISPGSRLSRSFGDIRSGDTDPSGIGECSPVYENGFLADLLRRHPFCLARLTSELLEPTDREAQTPKMMDTTGATNWDSLQKTLTIGCKKGRPQPRPGAEGLVVGPSERRTTRHQEPPKRLPVSVAEPSGPRSKVRRRLFEEESDEASSASSEDSPMEGVAALQNNWIVSGSTESVGINVDWADDDVELRHRSSRAATSLSRRNDESRGVRRKSTCEPIDDQYSKSIKYQTVDDIDNTYYETIGDDISFDSISRSPPPLPPPALPARNRRRIAGHVTTTTTLPAAKDPESRTRVRDVSAAAVAFGSEILDVNAQHIYTISDVLENLRRLASDLPKATESIEGLCLQQAAWLQQGLPGAEDAGGKRPEQERDGRGRSSDLEETGRGYAEEITESKHEDGSSRRRSRKWGNKLTINSKNSSRSFRSESPGTKEFESTKEEQRFDSLARTTQTASKTTSLADSKKNKAVTVVKDGAVTTSGSSTLKKKISNRNSKFRKLLVKPSEVSRPSKDDRDGEEATGASTVKTDPDPTGPGPSTQSDWYQRFPLKKLFNRIQNREQRNSSRTTTFDPPDKTGSGFHMECGTNPRPASQLDPKMVASSSTRRASSADRLETNRTLDCSRKMKNNCLDISIGSKSKMFKTTSSNSSLIMRPNTPGLGNDVPLPKDMDLSNSRQDTSLISNRRTSNPGKLKWIKVCTTEEIFC